jgi:diguanylate cyclase (GGDEF)-like protein
MASIAGPLVIIIEAMQRRWSDVALTAGGGMLLAALVLVRLMTLVGEANARRSELDLAMDQVSFLALHDPLTNLANRTLFSDRMEQVSVRARRHPSSAAVLLFDLDDFKAINDGMGHHVGDLLLTTVAERLLAATRDCDTVARLGGDEFAVLVDDLDRSGRAVQVAERILSAMTEPILGEDHMFVASGSIGIAEHDPMGDASDTMRHADLAMYAAKRRGKGRFVLFTPEMGDAALSPA